MPYSRYDLAQMDLDRDLATQTEMETMFLAILQDPTKYDAFMADPQKFYEDVNGPAVKKLAPWQIDTLQRMPKSAFRFLSNFDKPSQGLIATAMCAGTSGVKWVYDDIVEPVTISVG